MTSAPTAPTGPTSRPPLLRPTNGRVFAGVCAGVAEHLGWPVRTVRIWFAISILALGAGALFYLWLAITVPSGDPVHARPTALSRLVPALKTSNQPGLIGQVMLAVALLVLALVVAAVRSGTDNVANWLVPVLVLACGAALGWSQLGALERERLSGTRPAMTTVAVRVGGGVALAIVGVVMLNSQGESSGAVLSGLIAAVVVVAGAALVLAPWWLRLWRELLATRAERVRESERADIAAHLHDSVLQTLSLIRARRDDPDMVQRLARAQERELRDWLYRERPAPGDSVADELRGVAADVEDLHGTPIDVVTSGDERPTEAHYPLIAATREALVNAVVHGVAPVSLFVQINDQAVEVFVRDRGEGFDPQDIAPDRHGVRDSIVDRMNRHGGSAHIRSGPQRGTEVHLHLPQENGSDQ